MRKLAANYVISESGNLLKNSILIAEDDGTVLNYIDTQGHLKEEAQLIFYNGILLAGFSFIKIRESSPVFDFDPRFSSLILPALECKNELSIHDWFDSCKQVLAYFPDMIFTDIFNGVSDIICSEGGFRKESNPGIYLLTGNELVVLKLTTKSRLKRIL